MNEETLALVHRPFGAVIDDILTAMVGGVVNEPIVFDVKSLAYPLAEPASGIRGASGIANRAPRTFLKDVDFQFSSGNNSLVWLEEGTLPDDDTTFYVDYFRTQSRSPLTDTNVGSVMRTVSEAIGREIATLYQEVNQAHLAGFVDTAEGKSLDLVVSILDVTRKTSEFAEGLVTFFRDPAVAGNITIPEGLGLTTAKGDVVFVTTQPRTLQQGQVRIDVPVRAGDDFAGDPGLVDAGAITEMTQPLAGIERITNLDATVRAAADETDVELRLRAKAKLRALGKATLAALDRVIREGRATPVEFFDPNSPPANRTEPGEVAVVVEAEPERLPSIRAAVHQTRAAGVLATVVARYVYITPRVVVVIPPGISAAGKDQIKDDVIAAVQTYVDGLTAGDPAEGAELLAAIKATEDVDEATIVDVIVRRSDVSAPGAADVTDALVTAAAASGTADRAALRAALHAILTARLPDAPTGARIPDRSLIELTDTAAEGAAATEAAQIEAGTFRVVAQVAGEDWWIALDMTRADIGLQEQAGDED